MATHNCLPSSETGYQPQHINYTQTEVLGF